MDTQEFDDWWHFLEMRAELAKGKTAEEIIAEEDARDALDNEKADQAAYLAMLDRLGSHLMRFGPKNRN